MSLFKYDGISKKPFCHSIQFILRDRTTITLFINKFELASFYSPIKINLPIRIIVDESEIQNITCTITAKLRKLIHSNFIAQIADYLYKINDCTHKLIN
mgnify:CR=1 FL=1